jgi:hypothetical protein
VKVTSPFGKLLHSGDIVPSGQFGFTTEDAGNVMACFWIPGSVAGQHASVELKWKIGVNAKDWEGVAKKDKITGLELDLRKLEAQVRGSMTNVEALLTNICSALGAAPDEAPALDCAFKVFLHRFLWLRIMLWWATCFLGRRGLLYSRLLLCTPCLL